MKNLSIDKFNTYRQMEDMYIQDWVQLPRPKEMAKFRKTLPGYIKFKVTTKFIVTPTMEKSKYDNEKFEIGAR